MPRLPDILPSQVAQPASRPTLLAGEVRPFQDQRPQQSIALSRAMTQAGGDLMQIGEQVQDDVDKARTTEIDTLYAESLRKTVQGFQQTLGRGAIDGRDAAMEAMRKARRELEGKLDNPVQKAAFAKHAAIRDSDALEAIDRHTGRQAKADRVAQLQASISNQQQDAIAYRDGSAKDGYRVAVLNQTVDELATEMGIGPQDPQRVEIRRHAMTAVHAGIVERLIGEGRASDAIAYASTIKADDVDVDIGTRIRSMVQKASDENQALQVGLNLDKLTVPLATKVASANSMFERGMVSADVRNGIVGYLQSQQSIRDNSRHRESIQSIDEAETFATKNAQSIKGYESLPVLMRQRLEDSGAADKFKLWFEAGQQWQTNDAGYQILRLSPEQTAAAFPTQAALVAEVRSSGGPATMSNGHLQEAVEKWQRGRGLLAKAGQPDQMTESEIGDEVRKILDDGGMIPIRVGAVKGDEQSRAIENAEAFRLEQAIRTTAKQIGGANWKTPDTIKKAAMSVFANKILDENKRERLMSAMSVQELARSGWETPFGDVSYAEVDDAGNRTAAARNLVARGEDATVAAIATEIGRLKSLPQPAPAAATPDSIPLDAQDPDVVTEDTSTFSAGSIGVVDRREGERSSALADSRAKADLTAEIAAQWKQAKKALKRGGTQVTIGNRTFFPNGTFVENK